MKTRHGGGAERTVNGLFSFSKWRKTAWRPDRSGRDVDKGYQEPVTVPWSWTGSAGWSLAVSRQLFFKAKASGKVHAGRTGKMWPKRAAAAAALQMLKNCLPPVNS